MDQAKGIGIFFKNMPKMYKKHGKAYTQSFGGQRDEGKRTNNIEVLAFVVKESKFQKVPQSQEVTNQEWAPFVSLSLCHLGGNQICSPSKLGPIEAQDES
jgi:hypothetical protein